MEGRIGVGNVIGEHRQYPKEYTWEVFDMKTWNIGGSYSGKFLGRVPVDVK